MDQDLEIVELKHSTSHILHANSHKSCKGCEESKNTKRTGEYLKEGKLPGASESSSEGLRSCHIANSQGQCRILANDCPHNPFPISSVFLFQLATLQPNPKPLHPLYVQLSDGSLKHNTRRILKLNCRCTPQCSTEQINCIHSIIESLVPLYDFTSFFYITLCLRRQKRKVEPLMSSKIYQKFRALNDNTF